MRVRIIDVDQATGSETPRPGCDDVALADCYPGDVDGFAEAFNCLTANGRYWDGGGAAALTLLMRIDP